MNAKSPTPTTRKAILKPKTPSSPRKTGRPTKFSPELAKQICELISTGNSAQKTADTLKFTVSCLWEWLRQHAEFAENYARAREAQADYMDDLVLREAQNATNENYQVARLRIDAYKWRASHLKPKAYGEKQQVEIDDRRQLADAIREVAEAAHRARLAAKGLLIEGELVGETKNKN